MRNTMSLLLILFICNQAVSQSKKDKDEENHPEWKYEIEAAGTGTQGSYQVKIWTYSGTDDFSTDQAKKNAVHGVIFKGFPTNGRIQGQKPLVASVTAEEEYKDYFKEFFTEGGKYNKFITLVNNGAILPGDRIKLNKKEYKTGIIVNINTSELRKELEKAGIVKSLSSGF